MIAQEDFTKVHAPIVGTYKETSNANLGMRFRYMRAGAISFYWYDDKLEAFAMGNKFIQATNWEGNNYARGNMQRNHIWDEMARQAEDDADRDLEAHELRDIRARSNLSRYASRANLAYIIKHALNSGELTKEVIEEACETFNEFRNADIIDYNGEYT